MEGRGASRDATEIEINAYIVYKYIPLTSITAIHLSNKILFCLINLAYRI